MNDDDDYRGGSGLVSNSTGAAVRPGEIEEAVLGCFLLQPALLADTDVDASDFQSADARVLYAIMRQLGPALDVVTLGHAVKQDVNGIDLARVVACMEAVPSVSALPTYVAQLRAMRSAGSSCGGKPVVLVPGQHTIGGGHVAVGADRFTDRVLSAMPPGTLYRRGNDVGLVVGERGARRFEPLTIDATRRLVDQHVALFQARPSKDDAPEPQGDEPVRAAPGDVLRFLSCSRDLGGLVADAARTHRSVRDLVMLTAFPVYRRDWTLAPAGYADGIYYDEPAELEGLAPSLDTGPIFDALIDFPFRDEASRFNAIGLMLTLIVRHAVGNVPYHLIHSSMERTGKTKLVETIGAIVTGTKPSAIQVSEREEETEKRITGAMRAGRPLLFFDNLRDYLDSASLASLATASVWEGRILGKSDLAQFPNRSTVVLTGNNVRATGELVKRTVPILLQPKSATPEDRDDFQHPDLDAWITANRRAVMSSLIGLVHLWRERGALAGSIRLGGFEQWAACIGGVLEGSDWLGNARDWRRSSDSDGEDLEIFVEAWSARYGTAAASTANLSTVAREAGCFPRVFDRATERGALTAFGTKILRQNADRPVGRFTIHRIGSGSSSMWSLQTQMR